MKPSLQLRFSQQLTLTPQLQQSIRLLQMSTMELGQEIEQALAENPMLERSDDPLDSALRLAPNGGLEQAGQTDPNAGASVGETTPPTGENASTPEPSEPAQQEQRNDSPAEPAYEGDWQQRGSKSRSDNSDDESDYAQLAGSEISLRDHLMQQLSATMVGSRDRVLVGLLIDELNDDGYLQTDVAEVHAMLPAEAEIDEQEVIAALRLLQSFDPIGVGARDLRQCLLLQLDALIADTSDDRPGEHETVPAAVDIARRLVSNHLDALAAKDFNKLKRSLKCNDEMLRQAQQIIVGLSPRPGANFAQPELNYIVPDVTVRRGENGWVVSLNPSVMPKLRVNDMYADILRQNRGISGNLSGQLQEARWLIKNVQQRFDTILRVSEAIVDRQKAFFSHGEVAMRPLVLREIADTLGLHESTVSRVTTQKYMLTPHGTFELKYFFGSHVATDSGGAASSTAIRALIKQLIAAEDTKHPLSDNRIAQLLGEQGFVVARRTVAKYREAMRIYPVSQRKTL